MWMTAATLTAIWLWMCGSLRRIGPFSMGSLLIPSLLITTVLCRSTGALILLFCGLLTLWLCTQFSSKLLACVLLLLAPIYYSLRIPNIWTGDEIVRAIEIYVSPERAESLGFRFSCENMLTAKALQQPIWGWGGWGRSRITGEDGRDQAPTDGMWIIYFGQCGLAGLIAWTVVMILPSWWFLREYSVQQWRTPIVGPLASIAVLLGLYQIDCLLNGFINPILLVAGGGLICVQASTLAHQPLFWSTPEEGQFASVDRTRALQDSQQGFSAAIGVDRPNPAPTDCLARPTVPQERLAQRYEELARALKNQGLSSETKDAWCYALEILNDLVLLYPEFVDLQKRRCDCANDLAWFLLHEPDPLVRNPEMAVELAMQATQIDAECAAYWNTLGAAYFAAGDALKATTALQRSVSLTGGGTGFDFVFLALAHDRLGHQEQARHWNSQAGLWIEQQGSVHPELSRLYQQACLSLSASI
jgi:tetratricopeptide (TPR) repeat protein